MSVAYAVVTTLVWWALYVFGGPTFQRWPLAVVFVVAMLGYWNGWARSPFKDSA